MESGIHHFLVQGALDRERLDGLNGYVVAPQENGGTRVTGPVVDQAALHHLLGQIQATGVPLVMAVRAECPCRKTRCPRHGECTECYAYHAEKGKLPYCLRKKTSWDRVVGAFG